MLGVTLFALLTPPFGLRAYLELEPDIQVVGEAKDGAEGVRRAQELQPDVVLMDLVMPTMDGVEATRKIHHRHPEVRVVAVSAFDDPEYALRVIRAGARGYKTATSRVRGVR